MKWINLDPIKQSEVSQKEQNKYTLELHLLEMLGVGNSFIQSLASTASMLSGVRLFVTPQTVACHATWQAV